MNPVFGADGRPLDVLEVRRLPVRCVVGLYPSEARRPQALELSVALHLDTGGAADDAGLSRSIDYARAAGELRFILESGRFRTLEAAAGALARHLLAPPTPDVPRAPVVAVDVQLVKPEALAALTIRRFADQQRYLRRRAPGAVREIIHESTACGVYRLHLAPRSTAAWKHDAEEAVMVLGPALQLQRRPVLAGLAHVWGAEARRYDNPTPEPQTLLVVTRPRLAEGDEVEVPDCKEDFVPAGRLYYPPEANGRPR